MNFSAVSFILRRIIPDISSEENFLSAPLPSTSVIFTAGLLLAPATTSKGNSVLSFWTVGSENFRPISRFTSNTVRVGFWLAWFLAASPMSRTPSFWNATYEGVIRFPCSLGQTSTRPLRQTATQEYVVPKSMPMHGPSSAPPRRLQRAAKLEDGLDVMLLSVSDSTMLDKVLPRSGLFRRNVTGRLLPKLEGARVGKDSDK